MESAATVRRTNAPGDIAEIVMGQPPPGSTVSRDRGIPLLNGPTEFGSHHPTPAQYTTDARKLAQPGDLLFCVRGSTTGRMNWADQEYAIGRGVAAIRHRHDSALQPFVRGVVEVELPELLAQATGSTFPNVSARQLAEMPYPNLSDAEQQTIAHILGTLDDKIELNRRMNQTLEEMARALFKSWFVDFDPVRAKMAGRWRPGQSLPGLPADLYDLFPDRLSPFELGEIPAGWQVAPFSNVVAQLRDNENPLMSPDTSYSHYSIPAFDDSQTPKRELGENIKSVKTQVPPGTVLLSKLNPEIERVWLPDVAVQDRAICSTEFLVLQPKPPFNRAYVYCFTRSASFRENLHSLVTGTSKSHQRAPARAILSLNALHPPVAILEMFQTYVSTYLSRCLSFRRQLDSLATLRDELLPELMTRDLQAREISL